MNWILPQSSWASVEVATGAPQLFHLSPEHGSSKSLLSWDLIRTVPQGTYTSARSVALSVFQHSHKPLNFNVAVTCKAGSLIWAAPPTPFYLIHRKICQEAQIQPRSQTARLAGTPSPPHHSAEMLSQGPTSFWSHSWSPQPWVWVGLFVPLFKAGLLCMA